MQFFPLLVVDSELLFALNRRIVLAVMVRFERMGSHITNQLTHLFFLYIASNHFRQLIYLFYKISFLGRFSIFPW